MIERFNQYSPWKWQPELSMGISRDHQRLDFSMRMSTEDYAAFREIFLYGYYDQDLGDPSTVLDLGGYCGYSVMAFSARFPQARIAAMEPHPGNFAALAENTGMNQLSVTLFQAAATVSDGPVRLFLGGGMTHGLSPTAHSTGASVVVEGLSIPTVLSRLGWESIDLLKIDIEGAEEGLFRSDQAWLRQVRTIIGEHHGSYGISELRGDLSRYGFEVTALPHPNIFYAVRRS